jgi:hypothetical protein
LRARRESLEEPDGQLWDALRALEEARQPADLVGLEGCADDKVNL